jgi:hypothetical protein
MPQEGAMMNKINEETKTDTAQDKLNMMVGRQFDKGLKLTEEDEDPVQTQQSSTAACERGG